MASEDGGSAFPKNATEDFGGMSLRDWFAGQALIAVLANADELDTPIDCELAYQYADAMLAERQKTRGA